MKAAIIAILIGALPAAAQAEMPRPESRPADLAAETALAAEPPQISIPAPMPRPIALAAPEEPDAPDTGIGPETNLPLPRYVSLKSDEGNVRRGPSLSHRIDWVFLRRGMPLQIVAEYGHWRRVVDREGIGGWVHYALLSGSRTVLVDAEVASMRRQPDASAPEVARLEAGVIARLGDCAPGWCRITAGGYRGWARTADLWGVEPGELRD